MYEVLGCLAQGNTWECAALEVNRQRQASPAACLAH
jgi:hypothetical protein